MTTQYTDGYQRALELMRRCATPDGFVASPTDSANYRRIWGRDGAILGLAALATEEHDLIETCRLTLETLARYQGPHGEIPSNVDTRSDRISYGGTTGRVDADLWFIIGCGEYWQATGDDAFLERVQPTIEKVRFLLGAWEFNNRGLLYIPYTGDWADEYVHAGYVLYDQLLYLQAQRTVSRIHAHLHSSEDHGLQQSLSRLRHLIRANYWIHDVSGIPDDVYHDVLYRKASRAQEHCRGSYWMPFFSPAGYGYRFDAFANVLVSLLRVAEEAQTEAVDAVIQEFVPKGLKLLSAFYPVIEPVDEDWQDLQMTFSYTFKNRPHEYHNGGLWPLITGFYVADLARRDKRQRAEQFLGAVHQANALTMDGEAWSFPEYVHGEALTPGGTRHQGWSAAAAIIGHHAMESQPIFRIDTDER